MANKELITCDFAGCQKPFAYRIKGFNLCHEHSSDPIADHIMRHMIINLRHNVEARKARG